jgi:hypothetical protein
VQAIEIFFQLMDNLTEFPDQAIRTERTHPGAHDAQSFYKYHLLSTGIKIILHSCFLPARPIARTGLMLVLTLLTKTILYAYFTCRAGYRSAASHHIYRMALQEKQRQHERGVILFTN